MLVPLERNGGTFSCEIISAKVYESSGFSDETINPIKVITIQDFQTDLWNLLIGNQKTIKETHAVLLILIIHETVFMVHKRETTHIRNP